jgi:hypothetical protein
VGLGERAGVLVVDDMSLMSGGPRWGEEFVFLFLKSKYKEYSCHWVNRHEESGLQYDLILTRRGRAECLSGSSEGENRDGWDDLDDNKSIFVEVKSTTGGREDADKPFPISLHELLFANKVEERYQLFRVFRAGTRDATVLAVSDFYRRLTLASQLYCQVSVSDTSGQDA